MLPSLFVSVMMSASAASLPPTPSHLAEVRVETEGRPAESVSLQVVKRWSDKAIVQDTTVQRDEVSTALTPALTAGDSAVVWLVGYGLSAHENAGDTVVTYSLLLQLPSTPDALATAVWFVDRQEVPTSLFIGGGRVIAGQHGGAAALDLKVKDVDYGDVLSLTGLLRGEL
ncbi:MAG: hypothetical protein JXX28_06800 [Deltaproteobacteria bacterium]|nr:hypothetical protein [Deltaproteobacteria bacterium]